MTRLWALALVGCILGSGCSVNPVTGESQLMLVSTEDELAIGREQYPLAVQMQGGAYEVDPELSAYVAEVGQRIAAVSDRKLPYEFVVINDSVPNAWALPGGKIAVNRGLLTALDNEAELAAVLGHEIVHAAARHGAAAMSRAMLTQAALAATALSVRNSDYGAVVAGGSQLASVLVTQKYGRDAELEADLYGMRYMARAGYDPQAAVTLQEKFVALSKADRKDWLSGLFASHPPSEERVRRNQETAAKLQAQGLGGGVLKAEEYQGRIAELRHDQPAYDDYDKGRKALDAGHADTAFDLGKQAAELQAQEALFPGLMGDARFAQHRYGEAVRYYSDAIVLDNDFFHYFLKRGLALEQLQHLADARADLERSAQLLPTSLASTELGRIALAEGRRDEAKVYFEAAAKSDSAAGRDATEQLLRMDVADHPTRYLSAKGHLDGRGYVVVDVYNAASVAVRDVVLRLRVTSPSGASRILERSLSRPLGARGEATLATGLGPAPEGTLIEVLVVSAGV